MIKIAFTAYLLFILALVSSWIYGLLLGFQAHVFVGVINIIFPPLAWITGFVEFCFNYNIAAELAATFF